MMADLIELNALRAFGTNSVNRDDHGNTKTVTVGGDQRARQSSQSRKSEIRKAFTAKFGRTFHTRKIVDALMEKAEKAGMVTDDNKEELAKTFDELVNPKKKDAAQSDEEKKEKIHVYSDAELDTIVKFVNANKNVAIDDTYRERLNREMRTASVGAEIALFGRMVAGGVGDTVASATHFNHSYSIDDFWGEFDYFGTVDNYCETAGSAYIGHSSIASNTMYDYVNVAPVQMYRNLERAVLTGDKTDSEIEEEKAILKNLTKETILEMFKNALFVPPSGKQTTMASYPVPSAVYIRVIRNGFPCTLDNAFNSVIRKRKFPIAVEGAKRMVNFIASDEQAQNYSYRVLCLDSVACEEENAEYIGAEKLDKAIERRKIRELTGSIMDDLAKEIDDILSNV